MRKLTLTALAGAAIGFAVPQADSATVVATGLGAAADRVSNTKQVWPRAGTVIIGIPGIAATGAAAGSGCAVLATAGVVTGRPLAFRCPG